MLENGVQLTCSDTEWRRLTYHLRLVGKNCPWKMDCYKMVLCDKNKWRLSFKAVGARVIKVDKLIQRVFVKNHFRFVLLHGLKNSRKSEKLTFLLRIQWVLQFRFFFLICMVILLFLVIMFEFKYLKWLITKQVFFYLNSNIICRYFLLLYCYFIKVKVKDKILKQFML